MTRRLLVYTLAVAASVLLVVALIRLGTAWLSLPNLQPKTVVAEQPRGAFAHMRDHIESPLPRLLLQLIVIVFATRVSGMIAGRLHQPPVVGEIVGGMLLGPSLLGRMAPEASQFLFPDASMTALQLLSQIGVLMFMFIVGLEFESSHLRARAQTAVAVSHFSIVVPFVLGVVLALALYTRYAPPGVPFYAFALFCGIAMSITAFPVLARILEERQLTHTSLGTTALTCAAIDDVTAWSLLAFVVAVTTAGGAAMTLLAILSSSIAFVLVMVWIVRPLLLHGPQSDASVDPSSKGRIALILALLLAAALATEMIGIHALFGAFVAGAIMPRGRAFRARLRDRFETITAVLLLPLFFAYTGLRTDIGLLDTATSWMICAVIVLAATVGKIGGTLVAGRWTGMSWGEAFALGALMNTRGLMELVALNVGYDLGILSRELFAMLVLMALATTAMTGPLLSLTLKDVRVTPRGMHPAAANDPGQALTSND